MATIYNTPAVKPEDVVNATWTKYHDRWVARVTLEDAPQASPAVCRITKKNGESSLHYLQCSIATFKDGHLYDVSRAITDEQAFAPLCERCGKKDLTAHALAVNGFMCNECFKNMESQDALGTCQKCELPDYVAFIGSVECVACESVRESEMEIADSF